MNLKSLIIGFVLILIIVLGISKLLGTLSDRQSDTSSHLKETVGLQHKVKSLTETRAKQIQEREQQFQE
jgi:Tfp pilus assembly protein PilV